MSFNNNINNTAPLNPANPLYAHQNQLNQMLNTTAQTTAHNALRTTPLLHTAPGTAGYVLPQQSGLVNNGLGLQQGLPLQQGLGLQQGLPLQQGGFQQGGLQQGLPLQQGGFQQGYPLQQGLGPQQGLPLQQGGFQQQGLASNLLTQGVLPIQQGLPNNGLPLQQGGFQQGYPLQQGLGLQQGLPVQNTGFTSAPVVNPKLRSTTNLHTAPGTPGYVLPQQQGLQQGFAQQQYVQQPIIQQQYVQQPIIQQRELVQQQYVQQPILQQQIPVETVVRPTIVEETTRQERIVEVQPIIHREVDAPEVHVVEQHIYEREAMVGPTTITKQAIVEETVRPHIIEEVQNIVHREVPQTFVERVEQHVTEHITQPTVMTKQVVNQQPQAFVAAGGPAMVAPIQQQPALVNSGIGATGLNNNRIL